MRSLSILLLLSGFAGADELPAAKIAKDGDHLVFTAGTDVVAKYQFQGTVRVEKGEGTKPLAKPYFYPVHAPAGVPVTRAWPMERGTAGETTDHFHQKSVWFCHGDVIPEGIDLKTKAGDKHVKGVDFWSEFTGHGRIVATAVGEPKQVSPGHAVVETANEWRTPDGVKILDETRTIHFVTRPTGYLYVLEIDLHASACPVTFGDTKEGAMGVRVPDSVRLANKDGGGIVTSSAGSTAKAPAKDNLAVWGEEADWHDYSGGPEGKVAGLAIFSDPKNPHRAAWHTRAYGLMAANPFGRAGSGFPSQKGKTDLVKLAKGDHLKLRYGVFAHTGDAATGKVAEAFQAFADGK